VSAVITVFLATVAAVAAALLLAVRRAETRWLPYTALCLFAWLAFTAALATSGWLAAFDARPPHFFLLVAPALVGTIALAASPFGAGVGARVGVAALVGFQTFRIPVEWVLLELARAGVAPPQMTLDGRNFDIVTGLSAPLFAWLAARGRIGTNALYAWNALGLALLANVVVVAIASTPTPLRAFANDPPNTFVAAWPWCWLPAFLVPAALFGHLVALRKLRRMG
jgi:hypothetical protein